MSNASVNFKNDLGNTWGNKLPNTLERWSHADSGDESEICAGIDGQSPLSAVPSRISGRLSMRKPRRPFKNNRIKPRAVGPNRPTAWSIGSRKMRRFPGVAALDHDNTLRNFGSPMDNLHSKLNVLDTGWSNWLPFSMLPLKSIWKYSFSSSPFRD